MAYTQAEISVEDNSEPAVEETETTVEEIEEKAPKAKTKKKKAVPGTAICPVEEREAAEFDTTTGETVKSRTEGVETVEYTGVDNSAEEKDTQDAMNKENNQTTEFDNGIKSIKDVTPLPDEDKGDKIVSDEETKNNSELKPGEENVQDNPEHKEQENASDKDLDNLVNTTVPEVKPEESTVEVETSTEEKASEVTTTVVEETKASGEATVGDIVDVEIVEEPEVVVPEKVQPQVEPKEEAPVVPAAPVEVPAEKTTAPVAVNAPMGYSTTVGSSISFSISGDNVSISGLDGINYSFDGSNLVVNAGSEATVLTVEASNSVNSVVFDIMVNA